VSASEHLSPLHALILRKVPVDEVRSRRLQDQRCERCAKRPDGVGVSTLIGSSLCLSMHSGSHMDTMASLGVWDSLGLRLEKRRLCWLQGRSPSLIGVLLPNRPFLLIWTRKTATPSRQPILDLSHAMRCAFIRVPVRSLHFLLILFGPADASCQVTRT
jgi:hypothetical protein